MTFSPKIYLNNLKQTIESYYPLSDQSWKQIEITTHFQTLKKGETLLINYQDNGKGFDLAVLEKRGGIGMQNIQSRLQMVNADFQMSTSPGNGFKLAVSCPLA